MTSHSSTAVVPHDLETLSSDSATPLPLASLAPKDQVFCDQDLLTAILEVFLPNDSEEHYKSGISEARKELLKLALVSSRFLAPALRCLWRNLDSLIPLIRLLPSVRVIDNEYVAYEIDSLGSSFERHAHQVRTLRSFDRNPNPSSGLITVNPTVYILLAQRLEGASLLPGLESIKLLSASSNSAWHFLPLVIPSPSLIHVHIEGSALATPWFYKYAMPMLASRASSLKELVLIHEDTVVDSSLWKAITSFRQLNKLILRLPQSTNLPGDFLFHLGRKIVGLTELTLDVHFPSHTHPFNIPSPLTPSGRGRRNRRPFAVSLTTPSGEIEVPASPIDTGASGASLYQNLKSLGLTTRSGNGLCECFSIPSGTMRHVTSLTICIPAATLSQELSAAIVGQLEGHTSLKRVELKDFTPRSQRTICYTEDIIPFMHRINLEEVVLDVAQLASRSGVSAKESFDELLVPPADHPFGPNRRWLKTLILPRGWGRGPLGLFSLSHVAQHASHLQRLRISINSSDVSSSGEDPIPTIDCSTGSALKYLELEDYRHPGSAPFTPKQYQYMARYLDTLFPSLVSVTLFPPNTNSACAVHWEHIEHLRLAYREIRILTSPLPTRVVRGVGASP